MNERIKNILDVEYKCLNYGFVRLVDFMGGDDAIVQAARTSYGKGTKTVSEDRALIRYLMRNRHTSPFEMVEFKFHIKLPIFVARQWIRHRTANVNEYSGRYSEMPEECYLPEIQLVKKQSNDNKQGRSSEPFSTEYTEYAVGKMQSSQKAQFKEYHEYIEAGMARELARINLPLSSYTEWYWKIDLHNLFHFLKLRLDKHAQYEIRVYAEIIANIIKQCVPIAFEAFEDYTLDSFSISKLEQKALAQFIKFVDIDEQKLINIGLTKREISEFLNKIEAIKDYIIK